VLSGKGLCDELITRPEQSYRLCCVVVCDLETSRMGAPYIFDISSLRVKVRLYLPASLDNCQLLTAFISRIVIRAASWVQQFPSKKNKNNKSQILA